MVLNPLISSLSMDYAESSKPLDRSLRRAKAARKGKIRQMKKGRPEPDSTGEQCV
jgi:hypothetical protein